MDPGGMAALRLLGAESPITKIAREESPLHQLTRYVTHRSRRRKLSHLRIHALLSGTRWLEENLGRFRVVDDLNDVFGVLSRLDRTFSVLPVYVGIRCLPVCATKGTSDSLIFHSNKITDTN